MPLNPELDYEHPGLITMRFIHFRRYGNGPWSDNFISIKGVFPWQNS
jgi:hypothetical protein